MASRKTPSSEDQHPAKAGSDKELGLPDRLPAYKLLPFGDALQTSVVQVEQAKLNDIIGLLWFPKGTSQKEQHARIVKAVDLFESLKPTDGAEAMLAVQMVGTHHAALECLRRAMVPDQSLAGVNMCLKHATRLMGTYTQQLAALDKRRGKGQQKITVQHVQVADGGQAIVGNVNTRPPDATPQGSAALEAPAIEFPTAIAPKKSAKARR